MGLGFVHLWDWTGCTITTESVPRLAGAGRGMGLKDFKNEETMQWRLVMADGW